MCRWICCTSFFADVAQVSLPPCCLLMKKKAGNTVPPCILHYCQRAENLPAAGNWIHASGLDLDEDVPPSPNPFTGVWWAQMNGPGGGTHRRASRFSTDKHCSLLSSSSLLQLTHVSWVFLLSSATFIPFPLCICCSALKFSRLSSSLQAQKLQFPADSMTGFPLFPHTSWSPATGLYPASLIVTVLIICV